MNNELTKYAKAMLSFSSYTPLLLILSVRQVLTNVDYLHWGGVNRNAIQTMLEKFGVGAIYLIVAIIGAICCNALMKRIEEGASNGCYHKIAEISRVDEVSLIYVVMYIIPFMVDNNSSIINAVTLVLMLITICVLPLHSKLTLANPWLNITHSIYMAKYIDNKKTRKALLTSRSRDILEGDEVKIYSVDGKFCYGKKMKTDFNESCKLESCATIAK